MTYNREQERLNAIEMIKPLQPDSRTAIDITIDYALNELLDFENQIRAAYAKLEDNMIVAGLNPPVIDLLQSFIANATYLIRKDYTEEELNQMPNDVYNSVIASQQTRADLLRAVANKYNL